MRAYYGIDQLFDYPPTYLHQFSVIDSYRLACYILIRSLISIELRYFIAVIIKIVPFLIILKVFDTILILT